jgi:hypothetical protein
MNTTATRIMLALSCGLVWAGPAMSANEMRFSDLEARIAAVEQKTSAIPGLRPAAFLSDGDPIDAVAPNDVVRHNPDEELTSPSMSRGTSSHGMSSMSSCSTSCSKSCSGTCGCGSACQCGSCGSGNSSCGCETSCDACNGECPNCDDGANMGSYYAEVDMLFMRTHFMEDVAGKLSETYEFTPRFILGYETENGVGARVRYFTYGRTTQVLSGPDAIRFEFDYLDFEATGRFKSSRSELVASGGFRFAGIDTEWDGETVNLDAPGLTAAAEFRTMACGDCRQQWAAVAGARWSILGGDWEGSDNGFVQPLRDDNVLVQELYFGAELSCHYSNYVLWARLVFEMQNWRSDVMGETAGVDSVSLIGPGIHLGGAF